MRLSWTNGRLEMPISGRFLLLICLLALCLADHHQPVHYEFGYAVNDDYAKVDFGHSEKRSGYRTDGEYFVALPDGRKQTVEYFVDGDSGYVAKVSYNWDGGFATQSIGPAKPHSPTSPQPHQSSYFQPKSA